MATIELLKVRFNSFHTMYSEESRKQSFVDWPFREQCMCTPEKMATAGFVHCPSDNEPDVACCFYCLIELEGWEPDDNPRFEHVKRSPNCGFLTMGKDFPELTVAEFHHMERDRLKIYLIIAAGFSLSAGLICLHSSLRHKMIGKRVQKKACHMKMAYLREEIDKTLDNLKLMFYS